MKAISTIYLVWRKGKGSRRQIVGRIKRNSTEGVRFEYILGGVKEAQKKGFTPYIDFPDINKIYKENVLDIFSQRLLKSERSDIKRYHDFWSIDPRYKEDKFYLLAYTQGLLSTDNFEFLADFQPVKELKFVSEICGLTHAQLRPDILDIGDTLTWQLEKDNPVDKYAVKVFKDSNSIGYVKLIHSRVFHKKLKSALKIIVKNIDKNGVLNRVFVDISF